LLGKNFAVITVTGRKTGKLISTPVNALPVDGSLTIISKKGRTWWRNLRGGRTAHIHRAGKQTTVHTDVLETSKEVVAELEKYFIAYPAYAKYFGVDCGPDGRVASHELEKLAQEQVVIRLI